MKSNRLLQRMKEIQNQKGKVFSAFVTLGYPNLKATEKLILEFDKSGVDVLELGFPFSDPLADGPTIQYCSEQALKKGVVLEDAFRLVKRLRKKGCEIPIVLFTYLNPIFHYGLPAFVNKAKASGMDGVLVPDLPPEEEKEFQADCRKKGLSQVFLIAPTTIRGRVKEIARASRGFIYCVSLRGVTGARQALPSDIRKVVHGIRRQTGKPVLIGFGVSNPKQAKGLSRLSDGVIVGSAIMDKIRKSKGQVAPTVRFVHGLVKAVKGTR